MWILIVWFWTMFLKPSESYMRRLGRKSANRWLREAHYCPILHCKSLQYSASERRRLADFWPSHLIYASDCGLKSWNFCIRVEVLNFDQKSYQWTLITDVLNIFCFSRTWIYDVTELAWTCGSQLDYVCLENVSIRKTVFFCVFSDNSSLMVLVHLWVGLGNCCSLKSWGDSPTDNEEFQVATSKTLWFFCWFSSLSSSLASTCYSSRKNYAALC